MPWHKVAEFNRLSDDKQKYSIQPLLNYAMAETLGASQSCNSCRTPLRSYTKFTLPPRIYALDMSSLNGKVNVDHSIEIMMEDGARHKLALKGIIYSGGYHFTSRIIDLQGGVWYHDGIETGSTCVHQGYLPNVSPHELRTAGDRKVAVAVYSCLVKYPKLLLCPGLLTPVT
jgi:hypothetical protein